MRWNLEFGEGGKMSIVMALSVLGGMHGTVLYYY